MSDAVRDKQGRLLRIEFPWLKLGNTMNRGWNNTILGQIRIDSDRLTVEVNSAKRADRIQAEVATRIGSDIGAPVVTVKPPEDLVRAARESHRGGRTAKFDSETAQLDTAPEIRQIRQELMERHWDGWVETKIPALGGMTPIEAVKDAAGREMVEALLTQAERHQEELPAYLPRYDVDRVRIRLGLPARGTVIPIDRLGH